MLYINKFKGGCLTILCVLILAGACKDDDLQNSNHENEALTRQFFKENITLFDLRTRSTNMSLYVREIVFVNFSSEKNRMPATVNFHENTFFDDGLGFDGIKGDGVFTSLESFAHSSEFPFEPSHEIHSLLDGPIVSRYFKHTDLLTEYNSRYQKATNSGRTEILEITCEIEFGTKGCNVQKWGWCNSCCITVFTNTCTATIGW